MQTTKDLNKPEPREVPVRLSFLLLLFVGVLVSTTVRQELIQFQRYEAAYTLSRSSNGTVSSVSVTFHEVGKSDSVVVGTAASAAAQPSRSLHDEEAPKQEPAAPPQENAEEVTPQESADKKWTIVVDDSKAETSSESSPGKNIEQLKQEAATPEQPEQLKQDTTLTIEKTSLGGTNTAVEATPAVPQEEAGSGGNKTLVIIMGSLRGGEHAWQSLYQNLLDINHADLALAVGKKPEEEKTSSLYQRAKYLWEFDEYEDWGDALDLIAKESNPDVDTRTDPNSWRNILLPYFPEIFGGVGDLAGSGAIIFWIRWFVQHKLKELSLLDKYDRFIVTRSDFYYLCEHDLSSFNTTEVFVPKGEDYGGITDRFVIAPADKILTVLDILPPMINKPQRHKNKLPKLEIQQLTTCPEMVIMWRWQQDGIFAKRYSRKMFTVKAPGDQTRWSVGSTKRGQVMKGPHGLVLKYPHEYQQSQKTCGVQGKKKM